ncbi:MAG: response regulator [Bacteroidetes bacterium]|nr:response regulator [Bacteroidota bacterium]HET6242979.1 response regulator [Bacteroidia bacterium]
MKKCILICDDDIDILEVTKIVLQKSFKVETLTHCNDIFKNYEKYKPDLILMDLWIPDMGGEAITRLLKSSSKTKKTPVIIFSANNDIEKVSFNAGADGFLRKPFDIKTLNQAINDFLTI